MNTSLDHLLDHIDTCIMLSKPIFEEGARCAIYINLWNKYDIDIKELKILEPEIAKRDHNTAMISTFEGKVYTITLTNPWKRDETGEVAPVNKTENLNCNIQDLTPTTD